ncbi:MAG: asparaginase [Candidatus Gastranaerophilaceae bacterium]|nr:asparaginase [Candidatus Gastranaerophilaceae bacterium]
MIFNSPETIVKCIRDGLVEEQHFGYLMVMNKVHILDRVGESGNYPFYLRSCAKPLQASLMVDFGMIEHYGLTSEEIALCCASHAGEQCHTDIAKNLLKKIGLTEDDLKCGKHKPLSVTEQERMLLDNENPTTLHNNCSGKHIMMLGLCKMHNWDIKTYDEPEHPLQQLIKEKLYQLCELKKEYPVTTDGCGVPIYSMPLQNMGKGYLNLFCSEEYSQITQAFLNNPYIIGGENRTDTKIIENSENLVAKVGAGGLCIVVNIENEECLIIKVSDCDMKAREIAVTDALRNLHWANIETDHKIKTNHGKIVGEIVSVL